MGKLEAVRQWARDLKRDAVAVYFAARDPRTPGLARVLALMVAAYALSPIDLIPDFIPLLGYLDELVLLPLGLMLVIRLVPPPVLQSARARAAALLERPRSRVAAAVIVGVWLLGAAALAAWWWRR